MAHAYLDLVLVHNPATGLVIPSAWGDQIRENFEVLIDPPAASCYHSTTQSVGTGAGAVLLANSENYDNDAMHSTVSNTSRLTIQTAGRYDVAATIGYDSNSTGSRSASLLLNGTTIYEGMLVPAASGNSTICSVLRTLVLAVGDYVEARAFQTSGANRSVTLHEFSASRRTR